MADNFIEVHDVVKQFANHRALNGVSIEVPRGKVFGLLGPNGAGKTTLIRIINRITAPDSGEVLFNNHPSCPDDVYKIGYLPEERGLYKKMKVGEQAIYLAQLKGLSYMEARKRLTHWFEKFGIMPWWNKKLEELSKGMQQKVQFVITVIHDPELLIFDEPFSGFDPVNAELLKQEMLGLKDQGKTIIFSTHNMSSVEEVCDDIALINRSEVVLRGAVSEVRNRFRQHLFNVRVAGDSLILPNDLELVDQKSQHGTVEYMIRKDPARTNSELIQQLAASNELISFQEILPSMHDIFIQTVSETPNTPQP